MPEGITTTQEQITQLEQELQQKRAALGQQEVSPEAVPSDKEVLRQVIGEKIQQQAPQYQPPVINSSVSPSSGQSNNQPSYLSPELQDAVQKLINVAFAQSIDDAIRQATASNNAALIDAFHDVLVDQLYNELLVRGKIEPPKE